MALKDHKEELRCARDIAILLKWKANQLAEQIRQAAVVKLEAQTQARVKLTSGVTWGEW